MIGAGQKVGGTGEKPRARAQEVGATPAKPKEIVFDDKEAKQVKENASTYEKAMAKYEFQSKGPRATSSILVARMIDKSNPVDKASIERPELAGKPERSSLPEGEARVAPETAGEAGITKKKGAPAKAFKGTFIIQVKDANGKVIAEKKVKARDVFEASYDPSADGREGQFIREYYKDPKGILYEFAMPKKLKAQLRAEERMVEKKFPGMNVDIVYRNY